MELEKLIDRLSVETKLAVEQSAYACIERKGVEITLEDLLLTLTEGQTEFVNVLAQYSVDLSRFRAAVLFEQDTRTAASSKPVFSEPLLHTLQEAWIVSSLDLSLPLITSGTIVLSLIKNQLRYGRRRYIEMLSDVSFEQTKLLIQGHYDEEQLSSNEQQAVSQGGILEKVTSSITDQARDAKLDPVIGRDEEIRQAVDILCRRRKNNPILLGEAGVGKTAVVEGLAQKIVAGNVPEELLDVDLRLLDLAALQAGASVKGEFERRVSELIEAIQISVNPIILFIDEAHLMVGAGANEGGGDVANLIKPALARGEFRTIAATTWGEYKQYIEKDPALVRRFQGVKIEEPSVDQTVTLLRGLRERYESQHQVYIRDDALIAAASLSSRYLTGRQLPDKAIDLIDTACARVKAGLAGKPSSVEQLELRIESMNRKIVALKRDQVNDGYKVTRIEPSDSPVEVNDSLTNTGNIVIESSDSIIDVDENNRDEIIALSKRIDELTLELVAVESIWDQEKALVNKFLSCREEAAVINNLPTISREPIVEGGSLEYQAPSVSDEFSINREIRSLREELKDIQGDFPLVYFEVSEQQVSDVLSSWTGIPAGKMLMGEAQKLGVLTEQLECRVKGQKSATQRISEQLCQARVGLNDPDKPLGVFLLVGPSGVGKTETALTIADTLFGGEKYLTTINMSEFQEKHTVSRLIGSPPGYVGYGEGGVLTEAVRQKPFSVVLLDEVEKADPNVLNIFYQVFDKGVMNDSQGRLIDFRNTVIVLTSNLASDQIETLCVSSGDNTASGDISDERLIEQIRPSLNHFFKPALLARMEVLTYRPLKQSTLTLLVSSKLEKLSQRLLCKGVRLNVADTVLHALSSRCVLVEAGARHIDKLINHHIVPKLSRLLLSSVEQQSELAEINLTYENNDFIVSSSLARNNLLTADMTS